MNQHPLYLMWMKNKYIANSQFRTPTTNMFNNSWNSEQDFSDDVAFVWPPRSYSCSFCKRKLKSAQALGGHMNVHRRDRARLRLSHSSENEDISLPNLNFSPSPSLNHNPNSDQNFLALSYSSSIVPDSNNTARKDSRLMGGEENFSIGLNSGASRKRACGFEFSEGISPKRVKKDVLSIPFFLNPCSNERVGQGLDLELRLGDAPKLK